MSGIQVGIDQVILLFYMSTEIIHWYFLGLSEGPRWQKGLGRWVFVCEVLPVLAGLSHNVGNYTVIRLFPSHPFSAFPETSAENLGVFF